MRVQRSASRAMLCLDLASKLGSTNPYLLESLEGLPDAHLEAVSLAFAGDPLSVIASRLISERYPDEKFPLAHQREPFSGCYLQTIERTIVSAATFPEKHGALSSFIRAFLGLAEPQPPEFYLVEAHLNTTALSTEAFNSLVCLGFEPDNFFKLQPECYSTNLTLAFIVEKQRRNQFNYLRGLVAAKSESAAQLVQITPDLTGFFESEVYPSSWIRRFPFRAISSKDLEDFPFSASSFRSYKIPRKASEVLPNGLGLDARKVADVHIKIPTEVREEQFPGAGSEGVRGLRDRMLEMGFYEIVSETGNAIYTGQFDNSKDAVRVFHKLTAFGDRHHCFLDLVCEPCCAFWRKQEPPSEFSDEPSLAEVSPILRFLE